MGLKVTKEVLRKRWDLRDEMSPRTIVRNRKDLTREVKGRKNYECSICGESIEKGEIHRYASHFGLTYRICNRCFEWYRQPRIESFHLENLP